VEQREAVMSEMIERVARAISAEHLGLDGMKWEDCHPKYQEDRMRMGRAAIEAMRNPPKELQDQAHWYLEDANLEAWWNGLIDEALK